MFHISHSNEICGHESPAIRTWPLDQFARAHQFRQEIFEQTKSMAAFEHPCVRCGACCANFRVQFYWREANPGESEHVVPAGLFEELTPLHRCMKGTARKHRPQCEALKGRIGQKVSCQIYHNRPSPCRAFKASFEDGKHHPRCDEAREAHGLKPLTWSDWPNLEGPQAQEDAL